MLLYSHFFVVRPTRSVLLGYEEQLSLREPSEARVCKCVCDRETDRQRERAVLVAVLAGLCTVHGYLLPADLLMALVVEGSPFFS